MKGYIYKIGSPNTDQCYIGSTICKYLSQRKAKHLDDYRGFLVGTRHYKSSYEILKHGNVIFEILETVECDTLPELRAREKEVMSGYTNRVNKNSPVKKTRKEQLDYFLRMKSNNSSTA